MRTSTILLFLLFTIHLHAQKIKAYEYWVDDDPSTKVFTSITPVTNLHLQQALPVNMCSPGFHIFNIRFIDTTNTWSVISSQYFVKNPPATETDRQIAAYEYWIDDNSASRIYQTVVPSSQLHLTNPLDLNSVSMGFHVLSLRFKDNMGNWSSTQTQYFTKYGSPRIIPNKIVYCRFWYDTDMATQETLNLRLPAAIYNWADTVETPFLTIGNHTINYQFKDSSQTYSSISTDTFSVLSCLPHGGRMISGTASVHTGQAGVTYSIRKIKNATSYTWSVPAGASIVAGNNTHSIMVDYSLSAVSGDVSVYAANSCGNGNVMIYPVTVNAPSGPPNWIPVPNLQYNMNVIGKIQLSPGVYSLNENDLLGAFVGAECRGVAHPFAALGGTLFMTIGSNLQSGETVTFKVYLASANEILDANETIPFQNQGETGTMANPFIFTYGVTQCTLNVTPSNQDVAYGPSASASFAVMSNCDWIASSDQPWCSVTPSGAGNGTVTADYSQNITTLPRIAHITVTSPEITPVVVTLTQAGALGPPIWTPVPNLQYNMSVIGKIRLSPGVFSLNENDLLGAFVGNECRGVAHPFASLDGTLFMTIGSNLQSGETVTFKVYLASANEILDANETIPFQNQGETGTMANPFIFTYGVTQCNLDVTPSNQDVAYGPSASTSFTVMSNCDWIASSDQTWCSVTPSGSGNGAVTVNYSQNITTLPRIAHITVTSPEITPIVVTLTQAGAPGPPIWTPVPNLQYNMSVIGKVRLSPGVFSLNENDILGAFVGTECRGVANPFASLSGTLFLTIGSNNLSGENVTFKIFLASTNEIVNANETISFQNGGEAGTMDNPFLFTFPILNNVVIQGTTIITGQTSCYNALQTITVAGGGTNFVVQNGGVVTMIAGQKISFLAGTTVQSGGQLNAYITATNSYCSSLGSSMVNALVKEEINLPDAQALSNLLVYPNPTEGKFILELPGEELNSPVLVRIYNMKGLEVLTKQLTVAGKSEFSLESQTPGIYLVNMIKEGEMKMIKILKY